MVGNPIITCSVKRPFDGLVLENSFTENITITCLTDSFSETADAGNETFSIAGAGDQSNFFAHDWPLGSNAQGTLQLIDGNSDNTNGNILTNSGFEEWTTNTPDNWTVVSGASILAEETVQVYDGAACGVITGDGVTELSITQLFDDSTGTLGELLQISQYSFNIFLKTGAISPSTGVMTIDLIDQNGITVVDEAGTANTFDIDLTSLNTDYQSFTGIFRTPYIMPTTIRLRIRTSTVISLNNVVYFDKASMGDMIQLYTSGPWFAGHAAVDPPRIGDYTTCQITNSRGAAGALDTFQCLMARLFPIVYTEELLFPSSSSPTISDNLIVA